MSRPCGKAIAGKAGPRHRQGEAAGIDGTRPSPPITAGTSTAIRPHRTGTGTAAWPAANGRPGKETNNQGRCIAPR